MVAAMSFVSIASGKNAADERWRGAVTRRRIHGGGPLLLLNALLLLLLLWPPSRSGAAVRSQRARSGLAGRNKLCAECAYAACTVVRVSAAATSTSVAGDAHTRFRAIASAR